uniref:Uncharacterized protein LOC111109304 n=1 Tax=Crassostrea virginica TaxID=6565 RepID=A0A8B8BCE5_CRAVI|nr:uncharacterized protein LOC111109304 [Crassostrea virginica]
MTTGATTSSKFPTTTKVPTTTTLAEHSRETPLSTTNCKCQNNESISSSPFKFLETDYGVALTFLGFFLRNRFKNIQPRLKDEKNVHNISYDETQRFSNSLSIKALSSKDDEYSEISENNNDRKMVMNSKRKPALKEGNDNYDHLNDNVHAKTTDDGTYDHAEYQSGTNIHHQTDSFNVGYAQTNAAFADSSYTEVTGEGFVMSNEDISSDPYFVLEEKPCN